MSDRVQRGRAPEDLEAAACLLVLSRMPRPYRTCSSAREDAAPASGTRDAQENINRAQPQDATAPDNAGGAPRQPVTGEQALQAYLIRQQIIAGIPPERMTRMGRRRNQGQPSTPALVQISNDGVSYPEIPPAQFNGVFHPLPVRPPEFGGSAGAAAAPGNRQAPPLQGRSNVQSHLAQDRTAPVPRPARVIPVAPTRAAQRHRTALGSAHDQASIRRLADNREPSPRASDRAVRRHSSAPGLFTGKKPRTRAAARADSIEAEKFNIFDALIQHSELCLEVIAYIGPSALLQLYSISKSFHHFVNGHFEDAITSVASRNAPEAALLYPGRCYPRLCITPPKTGMVPPGRAHFRMLPPKVPSIKWLSMITYREHTAEAILSELERAGHDLPRRCALVIKKLWFLMDIPENTRRLWTIQNKNIWPDVDLFLTVLFLIKLETFLKPIFEAKCNRVRCLLLAQQSMTFLHDVIRGTALNSNLDLLRAYIRWKYVPLVHEIGIDLFGVPAEKVGLLQYEGYGRNGRGGAVLRPPDELVLRECVARDLDLGQFHVDFFFYDRRVPVEVSGEREPTWVEEIERDGRGKNMNRLDVVVIE
ncbi:hypothetical protein PHISP_05339 [Aspergillus sp. HF37]|nr:hypothetical protein PHISP_05339 [Aspergillus sp. HF37]